MYGLETAGKTYGPEINVPEEAEYFGRKCLIARRLLERGVRYVQIWSGNDNSFPRRNWDSHEDVERDHRPLAKASGKAAIHMVSAWATANQISLGQIVTDEKSNEITAIPKLLEMLEIKGCLVTIDAMGCQVANGARIVQRSGWRV